MATELNSGREKLQPSRVFLSACLLWLGGSLALPLLAQVEWKEFGSKELGFTALFPGPPVEQKQTAPVESGAALETATFTVQTDKATYRVTFFELMKDQQKNSAKKLLDQGRDAALQTTRGKKRSEKSIKLGAFEGRELIVDSAPESGKSARPQQTIRGRFFVVKPRVYQVMVMTTKGGETGAEVVQFLDSFQIHAAPGPPSTEAKGKGKSQ